MEDNRNIYCGIKDLSQRQLKSKKYGDANECLNKKQLRLFGKYAVNKNILNIVNAKKSRKTNQRIIEEDIEKLAKEILKQNKKNQPLPKIPKKRGPLPEIPKVIKRKKPLPSIPNIEKLENLESILESVKLKNLDEEYIRNIIENINTYVENNDINNDEVIQGIRHMIIANFLKIPKDIETEYFNFANEKIYSNEEDDIRKFVNDFFIKIKYKNNKTQLKAAKLFFNKILDYEKMLVSELREEKYNL